ncbi:Glutaredoxin, GrxC [Plesiocystis pacifica SIR-1]|uniref:Glutaredoxin, GrxC n=1 Tax=Plesiocystis pacifica SIR-1 TaxID=391625 RepID=A6G1Q6_9BACT|nr:glutaredoxin [Plesiocystis pacifica]EDM80096.1 Glutaredoxin, GrxC [Plesiocystis pacifica SIR-1]
MGTFPLPDAIDKDVVIYLTPWCPYCMAARRLLDTRKVSYEVVDVTGNAAARTWMRQNTGQSTVPQIFIKGESIGGFDELSTLDQRGGLREMLA